jgi:hypothetical protein
MMMVMHGGHGIVDDDDDVVIRDRDRGVDVYGSDTEAVIDDRR